VTKQVLLRMIEHWQANPNRPRGHCVFEPTCSKYARDALDAHGPLFAGLLIVRRVLRCNPTSPGGLDPVSQPRRSRVQR
jgi:uncharacterized protein